MKLLLLEIIRRKRFMLLLILFLILANIALMTAVASYQVPALNASRSKWSELRNLVARAGNADAAALHSQGKADLEKLNSRIPPKLEFARVLSDIFEAASNNAVSTGAASYKPLSIKEVALLSYKLSLTVSGDYASVKSFLSDIQQNQELIVVDSVSLTNNDLFTENVVMNLDITVYLREGA